MKNILILMLMLLFVFNASAQLQKKPVESFRVEFDNWTSAMELGNADALKTTKEKIEIAMVAEIQKKDTQWQPGNQTRSTGENSGSRTRDRGNGRLANNTTTMRQKEIYQKISGMDISEQDFKSIAKLDKLLLEFYDTIEE